MASANFDILHTRLARALQDPAAAASDGARVTSANRTELLNRASRYLQAIIVAHGEDAVNRFLRGLVATEAGATTSGSKALPTDYSFWLAVQKYGGGRATYINPSAKADLDSNSNPNLTLAFTIIGSTLYIYENGSAITNAAHILYYVKNDARAQAGDSADIAIDPMWYDAIVDIATSFALTELGEADKANQYLTRVGEMISAIMKAN